MNADRMQGLLPAAIAQGLLPDGAHLAEQDTRPWPVVLLTALGAWLAALPLMGVMGLLFGDALRHGIGPYLVGAAVLGGAIVVLRSRALPLFFEQLAVPALLVGAGVLALGLWHDLPEQGAAGVLAFVALGAAAAIPRPWLRVLLGAAAALLAVIAWVPIERFSSHGPALLRYALAWHADLGLWLLALAAQRLWLLGGERAPAAAALESLCAGWLLAMLGGLAWWSGMSFLVGGTLGGGVAAEIGREISQRPHLGALWPQMLSAALTLVAAAWALRAWPGLRRAWLAIAAALLAGLAWFVPALGATLLALSVCVTSARGRLAATAALAAAWEIGSFYYALDWPLGFKAMVLTGIGTALGALAWWAGLRANPASAVPRAAVNTRWQRAGIAASALLVLLVANLGIREKEALIAHGQPLFVALAPVDPRSLMQGDFMRLNFSVPVDEATRTGGLLTIARPHVVARRDERGVATLRRDDGTALTADELRIELTPKDGRWCLVSDAWFFKEGEGQRWAAARYAEFRVEADGRALLVGLRGPNLEAL